MLACQHVSMHMSIRYTCLKGRNEFVLLSPKQNHVCCLSNIYVSVYPLTVMHSHIYACEHQGTSSKNSIPTPHYASTLTLTLTLFIQSKNSHPIRQLTKNYTSQLPNLSLLSNSPLQDSYMHPRTFKSI